MQDNSVIMIKYIIKKLIILYDSIDIQGSKKIICINNQDFQQYSKYFKVLAEDSRYRIEKHKESLFYYQIQLQPIGQSKPCKKSI
jgi:hypothetical protein